MTTGDYINTTVSDIMGNFVNNNTFLPAIQCEYVWETSGRVFQSTLGLVKYK
jgi:hypothetical protein